MISYLVGWLNRNDLHVAAHQELTRRWWTARRGDFDLFASAAVIDEAREGHPALAEERLKFLDGVSILRITGDAYALQDELLRRSSLPAKAGTDALHIAVAAVHGMEFLTTWNCKHIANAVTLPLVYETCRESGYEPPLICTVRVARRTPMNDFRDPVIEEIHETRKELLQRYGGPDGYARHLREVESQLAGRLVTRDARPPVKTRRKVS